MTYFRYFSISKLWPLAKESIGVNYQHRRAKREYISLFLRKEKIILKFMDNTDRKILRALQAHPSVSITELAERVGLSQTPCWRRVKKLEAEGVIRERAVVLNAALLGLGVSVFASLRLKQHDEETLNALEAAAQSHAEIVECYSMSGESDYVLRVVVRSIEDYERFLKKVLLHFPGVASVNSSFALKCVKLTTRLPIDTID
jgi:Lrp/AsnC family transcriptional regulator